MTDYVYKYEYDDYDDYDDYDYDQDLFPALCSADNYVELKRLIIDIEKYRKLRDIDKCPYTELEVIKRVLNYPKEVVPNIIYNLGQNFITTMDDHTPCIIRLAILKDIYKNGGRHVHWCLKDYIIYNELNPLKSSRCARQCSYEKYFQKVMSTFIKEFSVPVPKEKLVLDQDKNPLTWWKEKVDFYLKGRE